jgi:hypothetical protein
MKLNSINRLDEALALHRAYLVTEGLVSDLIGSKISQFSSWVQGHSKVVKSLGFENLVAAAKKLDCSLLDDSPEAAKWWKALMIKFAEEHGEINSRIRKKLVDSVKQKIEPQINREMEDVQKRLEDMAAKRAAAGKSKEELAEWMRSAMFDGWGTTHEPRRKRGDRSRRSRRDHEDDAYESKINYGNMYAENLGSTIAGALDMMNPNQRVNKGASIVRASNNAKIATLAITMIAKEIRNIKPISKDESQKRAGAAAKSAGTRKITTQFNIAQEINKYIEKYKGDDKKFLGAIRNDKKLMARAKKVGMNIEELKHAPGLFPDDIKKFKELFGDKKEEAADAKVLEEPPEIKGHSVDKRSGAPPKAKRRRPSQEREDDTYKHLSTLESKRK